MPWTVETAPRQGRPPGTKNRITLDVRDACIEAADAYPGEPGRYDAGMVGYFAQLRDREPAIFAAVLRACIPKDLRIDAHVTTHAQLAGAAAQLPEALVLAAAEALRAIEARRVVDVPVRVIENGSEAKP